MDFVVVGVGLGALAVLVGLLLRDRGASWRRARPATAERDAARRFHRTVRHGGGLLAAAGGLLLLVTALALVLGLDDRTGAIVVLSVVALGLVLGLAWVARSVPRRSPVRAARPAAPAPARAEATAAGAGLDANPTAVPLQLARSAEPEAEAVGAVGDDPSPDPAGNAPAGASDDDVAFAEPPSSPPVLHGAPAASPDEQDAFDAPGTPPGETLAPDETPEIADSPTGADVMPDNAPPLDDALRRVAVGEGRVAIDAAASTAGRANAETEDLPSSGAAHQRPANPATTASEAGAGSPESDPVGVEAPAAERFAGPGAPPTGIANRSAGGRDDQGHEDSGEGDEAAPGARRAHVRVVPNASDRTR